MTEYEKSQKGLPHIFDDEMMRMFRNACRLTKEYNQTDEEETDRRNEILTRLLGSFGKNLYIVPDFHCEYGKNILIGNDVLINTHCMLMDNAEIRIGNHVLIGPNVSVYTVNHAILPEERANGVCIAKPVIIEDNVWLCGNVQVTAGVKIGEGSVIGAGSVVTKDVPPRVIAAGNPCRVIRKITDKDRLILR